MLEDAECMGRGGLLASCMSKRLFELCIPSASNEVLLLRFGSDLIKEALACCRLEDLWRPTEEVWYMAKDFLPGW